MSKKIKYSIFIALFLSAFSLFSISPEDKGSNSVQAPPEKKQSDPKYPVKKTQVSTYEDLTKKAPIDLKDPSNVKSEIEYDSENKIYLFKTKIGDDVIVTPFSMSADEYMNYSLKQAMSDYFRSKNEQALETKDKDKEDGDFSFKDIKIGLGPAERIFGPGGVRIKTQGSVEVSMGMKHTSTQNPSISEKNRSRFMFDFDQKIQLNVNASVGDKVNFGMNYDTEATFDFDSQKLKLAYEGKEDEIIKHIEAGNVSMSTSNSLINGGAALFGIKAGLQFGKLKVDAVISQQESESKTVNSKGGTQTTPFELTADQYDQNRHFFLSHYFRDNYDKALSKLPTINSAVIIDQVEVWVTNKRTNFENARNIVAFADLGEVDSIKNKNLWDPTSNDKLPRSKANTLYDKMTQKYGNARDFKQVTKILKKVETEEGFPFESGKDYEKLENARLLSSSEYTVNSQLGYISLQSALQADEVLAVAFKYRYRGEEYKVGEFASEIPSQAVDTTQSGALYLKLLKPTSLSPRSYSWDLMMKNIYSLGAYQVQKERFRLNISYQNDTTGTYTNYIQAGKIKDKLLLKVMNLDSLDSKGNARPGGDGIFDFVEGVTILSQNGRIIFPVLEPFGKHLLKQIGDIEIANKYVYQELYDSTYTIAKQLAEKNKFKISGEYKAAAGNEINLNATNVAKGSVKVMAGGTVLQEGVHYTVDYTSGTVTIIDESYANSSISVSLENQSFFNMQKKTMLGLNLSYDFSKDFNVGATIMHMYEKPLTVKTGFGNESLQNTLWGLNTSYKTQSQWLTNMIDKLPFVNATQPSQINFNAEFAHMIPGHYKNKYGGGYSYLDDFESTKSRISLKEPYAWRLAAKPVDKDTVTGALFPDINNDKPLEYEYNRALLSWYTIDNLFTRRSSSLTPEHIKNDREQLSNHYVREVSMSEVYPGKQTLYNEASTIYTLNLSFYPNERGPYNLNPDLTDDGFLKNPKNNWGGMTQKIGQRDFEAINVEYIEFWLMDPFIYDSDDPNAGGDLYFNLGEISEDVIRDGMKFYENGLPLNNDTTAFTYTTWGKVPTRQSTTYAFNTDLSDENKRRQDVGLNGLSTQEELEFPAYRDYLAAIKRNLNDEAYKRFEKDPAGDNYHYFRGSDYDRDEVGILDRYKYYNNTEGNSITTEKYSTVGRTYADAEDIDQDYTMNETEAFFQYKLEMRPGMKVGDSHIVDSRKVKVKLRNDKEEEIVWYQFRVPIKEYNRRIGGIQDFKSIRFVRMFMHGFQKPTHLRFASLDLVRAEWRPYTHSLNRDGATDQGTITVSAVNIEENGDKQPVNYVLPPDVTRVVDPGQPNAIQENEQSLAIQIDDLAPNASRAVYKSTNYDLRRYKRLQMYTHLEEKIGEISHVGRDDLSVFIRLGSDYKNNYYEYEVPLTVTPHGRYNDNHNDRLIVWPESNMFDFSLELLKNIKLNRNKEKRRGNPDVSYTSEYAEYDPEHKKNKVTVMGNPSLSDVKVMMIGVRNKSGTSKSGEIWVNELRLTDFDEEGGWAAQASLNVALSDIGNISVSGRKETAGFGALDQSLMERRSDDFMSYNIATNVDIGRFLPEKAKLSIPFYYSYSKEVITPDYDPLDQDVKLEESLSTVNTKQERDSIKSLAEDKVITKSINFNNVKLNIQSETPMPYDPANFSFSYSFSETKTSNPTTVFDATQNYRALFSYSYSPIMKSWVPFKNVKSTAPMAKYAKSLSFNYLPNNVSFTSQMNRLYTETMIRDIESYMLGGENSGSDFLSWSQEFYWDRDFSITWDFTKNLKASFNSGTRAEIEEPYLQVNKKLNKEDYEIWKDSIVRSILHLGRPLEYRQNAKVNYTLPFNDISFLNWISSTANYESNYTWNRGAETNADYKLGNTINNNLTVGINSRLNLQNLYNKSAFLKEVNQKFDSSRRSSSRDQSNRSKRPARKKRFEKDIILLPDSAVTMSHNLKTKNILVTAKHEGRSYPIKFKKIDENQIKIESKDSVEIKISIIEGPEKGENTWYKIAQYAARGLMSVRSFTLNINHHNSTYIPGFDPSIGDVFGQASTPNGSSPGAGFAFGLDGGSDFINKALNNDWLIRNEDINVSPAVYNSSMKVDYRAELEPIKGFKITLNGLHEKTNRTDFQFMYEGVPKTFGGSFTMTTIALSTAFQSSKANNDYQSAAFDRFLDSRSIIAGRLAQEYKNIGEEKVSINKNSPDVLIPAFLSAYTGKDPNKTSLSFFPGILSMLPNWNVTYDGLINIPWIKKKFKTLKLSHAYTAQYRVGSYESFASWEEKGNGLGYIKDPVTDERVASSPYNVSSISLTEAFNPLFGAEGTLNNSMTIRVKYNKSRTLNLNMSAYQIVESGKNELVIGMGYKIADFNRVLGITSRSKGVNNDLNINVDLSYSNNNTLIRKIEEHFTQATGGTKIFSIKASADYTLSKSLILKAYFDRIMNTPLISASAFPTANTDFGITLRFTLNQ